jgi:hypothetical protein
MAIETVAKRMVRSLPRYFHEPAASDLRPGTQQVERRRDLSYEEFVESYVRRQRPVIITDCVPTDRLTPQTIRERCGHKRLDDLANGGGANIMVRGRESAVALFKSLSTLGEYITLFEQGADVPYLTNVDVGTTLSELADGLETPAYFKPNWRSRWPLSTLDPEGAECRGGEAFFGPRNASFGVLHFDRHAVFLGICQYYGTKLWWLCPPEAGTCLYPDMRGDYPHLSQVNPFQPDLERFPLFANVQPFVATLEPGDAMFLPAFWWHITNAVTANISTLVRVVNRHNVVSHLWDMKYYGIASCRSAVTAAKRLLPGASPKRRPS